MSTADILVLHSTEVVHFHCESWYTYARVYNSQNTSKGWALLQNNQRRGMGVSEPLDQIWMVEIRRERDGSPERHSCGAAIDGSGFTSPEFIDMATPSIIG